MTTNRKQTYIFFWPYQEKKIRAFFIRAFLQRYVRDTNCLVAPINSKLGRRRVFIVCIDRPTKGLCIHTYIQ